MKAVIYARYSSHNQREESIEDQVRVCEEAAEREGDEVVAVYFDRAVSGTTDRREGFQAMIGEAKGADWKRVWTYKTDRFARNRYDAAIYKRRLQKNGVSLKYAAEPIPDGPVGVLMESVLEGVSEYYSANLGENVVRGLNGNAIKRHPNGVVLYGWDIAGAHIDDDGKYHPGDHYEINRREAAAVHAIFELRPYGYSFSEISGKLNELGFANKLGRAITARYVAKIVRDERYKGVYLYGDFRIEGGMPAIVTEAEWEAAQAVKPRKRKKHRSHVRVQAGMTFGNLEALEVARIDARHHYLWLCECHACSGRKVEWATRLTSGRATDCGCLSGDGRERDERGRFA